MKQKNPREIDELLARISAGPALQLPSGIALVRLLLDGAGPNAELLPEALEQGHTHVTEIGEGGDVNTVRLKHDGGQILLVLDGEEITGAKQNRVFNASFLVAPKSQVTLPVSCVERGRWRYESRAFGSPKRTLNTEARMSKLKRVVSSVKGGRSYDADQGAVWGDVDAYLCKTQVGSATSAYSDAAEVQKKSADELMKRVEIAPNQAGIAVVFGDKLLSLDLFGSPALFQRAWETIGRGIFGEVYEQKRGDADPVDVVRKALEGARKVEIVRTDAPGLGQTLHGDGEGYACGAVVHDGKTYHCVVTAS